MHGCRLRLIGIVTARRKTAPGRAPFLRQCAGYAAVFVTLSLCSAVRCTHARTPKGGTFPHFLATEKAKPTRETMRFRLCPVPRRQADCRPRSAGETLRYHPTDEMGRVGQPKCRSACGFIVRGQTRDASQRSVCAFSQVKPRNKLTDACSRVRSSSHQ